MIRAGWWLGTHQLLAFLREHWLLVLGVFLALSIVVRVLR